jgi:hypothetical protein
MLHRREKRIYRIFWAVIPLALVAAVLTLPALQKPPVVKVLITDSIPDYLYKENETIRFSFDSEDLSKNLLEASWTFGDSILVWQEMPPDSCNPRIEVDFDWKSGTEDSLGHRFGLRYDTLPAVAGYNWAPTFKVNDSVANVRFPRAGRYKLRLSLKSPYRKSPFIENREIEIVPVRAPSPDDTVVRIIGPQTGLVGEELIFSATGNRANFWYWKFGDNKHQDDSRSQVTYTYSEEGTYEVTLKTDNPDAWFSHRVEISPTWNVDSIVVEDIDTSGAITSRYKMDIRSKLQAISNTAASDTKQFYELKTKIERYYLSERYKPVDVWVNDDPDPVDFDSYCQRIHFLEGQLVIEEVNFEWDGDSTRRRLRSLAIKQKHLGGRANQ